MERRAFFKLAGISAFVAAGGALYSCSSASSVSTLVSTADQSGGPHVSNDPEVSFSVEYDALVVGSGIAGLSAAMPLVEAGRRVVVVDKLELLGGESYASSGVLRVAGSTIQTDAGFTKAAAQAWDARRQQLSAAGVSDVEFVKNLYLTAPDWVDHLVNEYGAKFADPKTYVKEGALQDVLLPKNGLGDMASIMTPLRDGLSARGATFMTGMRATDFVLDETGTACGMRLRAVKSSAVTDVRAKIIVLATGGFASSQPLVHAYAPTYEKVGCCTTASMGEGLILGGGLGGQLDGLDGTAPLTSDIASVAAWGLFGPVVIVDAQGKRFAREDDVNAAANACFTDERGLWWTIYDKQVAEGSQSRSIAETTSKNAKRVVGPFDSLEALASGMGVPATTLASTFDRYESLVAKGKDDDYSRTAHLAKLSAPYWAFKQFPVRYKTRGGLRTDGDGRMLAKTGNAISSVFCCGSVTAGSVEGLATNGAFGYLAGQAAAKDLESRN